MLESVAVGEKVLFRDSEGFDWFLAFGVFAEDIDLDIERAAGSEGAQAGCGVCVGDDGDLDLVVGDGGYGEGDAFHGDGAFFDDVAGEGVGDGEAEAVIGGLGIGGNGVEGDEGCGPVDVPLNDVASEGRAGGSGEFEVDGGVGGEVGEGSAGDGLGGEVGGEAWGEGVGLDVECGEANSADRDAVSGVEAADEFEGGADGDAGDSCVGGDTEDGSGGFDEPGEHEDRVQGRE